jgi:hypothetical protein
MQHGTPWVIMSVVALASCINNGPIRPTPPPPIDPNFSALPDPIGRPADITPSSKTLLGAVLDANGRPVQYGCVVGTVIPSTEQGTKSVEFRASQSGNLGGTITKIGDFSLDLSKVKSVTMVVTNPSLYVLNGETFTNDPTCVGFLRQPGNGWVKQAKGADKLSYQVTLTDDSKIDLKTADQLSKVVKVVLVAG